jgi:tetratricopeptide (TPR) repeat protein
VKKECCCRARPFGLIAALALPAICMVWRRFPRARWLAATIALQMLAVLPVFVTERYRFAAAPGLMLFAAVASGSCGIALQRRKLRRAAIYLLLLAGCTAWISTPPARPELWALRHYHAGTRALDRQDLPRANEQLQLAAAYSPQNLEVQFALGNVALATGHKAEARERYRATLAADPRHVGALNNLGLIALDEQDFAGRRSTHSRRRHITSRRMQKRITCSRAPSSAPAIARQRCFTSSARSSSRPSSRNSAPSAMSLTAPAADAHDSRRRLLQPAMAPRLL